MSFGLIKGLSRSFRKVAMGAATDEDAEARTNALRLVSQQTAERRNRGKTFFKLKAKDEEAQRQKHRDRLLRNAKAEADKAAQEAKRKAEDLAELQALLAEADANKGH